MLGADSIHSLNYNTDYVDKTSEDTNNKTPLSRSA